MTQAAWASSLPTSWSVKPLKAVARCFVSNVNKKTLDDEIPVRLCNYTDVYNNEFITPDLKLMVATSTERQAERFGLAVGDVVITKDSESWDDIGVPALVTKTAHDLVCGYHLALLRPAPDCMHGPFLFRAIQAKPIRTQLELAANGVTRFGLPISRIGAISVPVPPLQHQRAIAHYLDRETARIDALIVAKTRLLELLTAKRLALAAHALSRGLGTSTRLRKAKSSWLAHIPEHWAECHLKRVLADVVYGIGNRVESAGKVAVLRMGNIQDGEVDYSSLAFVDEVDKALILKPNDLLFNRTNSLDQIGKVAIFRGECEHDVSFASYLVRLRCTHAVTPEYLNQLLNSSYALAWARAHALPAIGQANLNPNRYGYLPLALPPLAEQRSIVKYLATARSDIDNARARTQRTIELLAQLRAALISAAVTGHHTVT